ncbi:MAG: hypothetical protein FWE16_05360 [Firmicutes bacterium]|nr:hypothetical protein [Bacillota bacterium]
MEEIYGLIDLTSQKPQGHSATGRTKHPIFCEPDGKARMFKECGFQYALSEVFNSKVGQLLGADVAKNEFAIATNDIGMKARGVASEVFIAEGQSLKLARTVLKFPDTEKDPRLYKFDGTKPDKCFLGLNFEELIKYIDKMTTEEFQKQFAENWLFSAFIGKSDSSNSYNVEVIQEENKTDKMAPVFDMESTVLFSDLQRDYIKSLPITTNIGYMKRSKKFSQSVSNFMEKLKFLDSSQFKDLCDFRGLGKYVKPDDPREHVIRGINVGANGLVLSNIDADTSGLQYASGKAYSDYIWRAKVMQETYAKA